MIPKKLELRNFLSYGEHVMPLDFTGMQLVCLSGDNGNGKSAILDAITWALWGEARASADDLVRLGADEMRVVFDFELAGDMYRVIRGRNKRSSANVWELYIFDESGGLRSITGQGMRDTGAKIKRLLRMDYKTFINSAYIQQGRADEFTKQSVGDRKKILADILDLSRYDALEQKAKERRNDSELTIIKHEQQINMHQNELEDESAWKTELEETQKSLNEFEKQIDVYEDEINKLNTKQKELDAETQKVGYARKQIESLQAEKTALETRKSEQERRINSYKEIIRQKQVILDGIKKLNHSMDLNTELDKKLYQLRSLENDKTSVQMLVNNEQRRLEQDLQNLKTQLADAESRIKAIAKLEAETKPLYEQASELELLSNKLAQLYQHHSDFSNRLGELKNQYTHAVEQKKDLEGKKLILSKPGAKCPVCKTELGEDKHHTILEDYTNQINDIDALIHDYKKQGVEAKNNRDNTKKEIDSIEAKIKSAQAVKEQITRAEIQIAEYTKSASMKPEIEKSILLISEELKTQSFAKENMQNLKSIDEKIRSLEYDEIAHRKIREELPDLRKFESMEIKLKHAEENLSADESDLHSTAELIDARSKQINEHLAVIDSYKPIAEELKNLQKTIANTTLALNSARTYEKTFIGKIAGLENSLKRCDELRSEIKLSQKELVKAKRDKSIYTELMLAFGKKGVQALIIENAVPEIQEEANRLLARMTDNSMQISIETTRDKKTGGIAETLDIHISDDMGTRPYELYSGGEAFRVNFALRIALSRLLAGRSGARLQTLIIDEGFGTQDGKGREKLIEAIDSIKDDFELILVISHIDELKDAFPTRIEVTKDEYGSQITVA